MSFPYNTTNGSYTTYLTELSEFLTKRLIELYPLTDYQELLKSWKLNFKVEEGKPNEKAKYSVNHVTKSLPNKQFMMHIYPGRSIRRMPRIYPKRIV